MLAFALIGQSKVTYNTDGISLYSARHATAHSRATPFYFLE